MAFGVSFRKAISGFPFKGFALVSSIAKPVTQADLELLVLFLLPDCGQDYRCEPPHPVPFKVLFVSFFFFLKSFVDQRFPH